MGVQKRLINTQKPYKVLEHHDDLQYHMGRFKHEVFCLHWG